MSSVLRPKGIFDAVAKDETLLKRFEIIVTDFHFDNDACMGEDFAKQIMVRYSGKIILYSSSFESENSNAFDGRIAMDAFFASWPEY